ncbi:hypothetical protein JQN72_02815 [Phycicoccus sp. CSK15P-2]|uniref:hypothetical protein n=1 Tax=Phycicoccus sp. CSK15P-2 TaxID=2807627 RepID=UPI001950B541|nr:hypothetical protein [Phycicoccus sp. CSK15P-2]MBM6403177.1 hypothetical protein [Phycicoccus sp. CSK15P-2]
MSARSTSVTCSVCGAAVHPSDPACPACGADLAPTAAYAPGAARAEDDAWRSSAADHEPTMMLDEFLPLESDPREADPRGGWVDAGPAAAAPPRDAPPSRRRRDGGLWGALVVILVVALVLAGVVWFLGTGGGDEPEVAATGTPAPSSGTTASPDESTPESPSSSPEESPSESGEPREVVKAEGATRCEEVEGGAVAWSGNDVTSCPFAVSTAEALRDAAPELPAGITAYSSVTDQDYEMQCENTRPVECRGGEDALVYVELP